VGVIGSVTAVLGLFLAWLVYGSGRVDADALEARLDPLPRTLLEGWYVDSAYEKALAAPSLAAARLTGWVDERGIDGLVNGIGVGVRRLSSSGRLLQTGFVRSYGLAFLLGAVAILAWVGVRT
jgi:NADH-quinone oxidoreductase subunit L